MEQRIDSKSTVNAKSMKVQVTSSLLFPNLTLFVGEAIRYVENEVVKRLREGYQEKKGQQHLPQQQSKSNLNFKIDDDNNKSHPQQRGRLVEESHTAVESENGNADRTSCCSFEIEEEEILQDDHKKKSSRESHSHYGKSLLFEASEDFEPTSSPEILSKKIAKTKRTGAPRPKKSQENSDEIQLNKRNATILLRPAPVNDPQSLGELNKYYITEKCEGMNCYWDGTTLYTSSFKKCNPYQEFLEGFPNLKLVGQLVSRTSSTVQQLRSLAPTPTEKWLELVFIVQDLHDTELPFKDRFKILKEIKETQFIAVSPYRVFEEEDGLDQFIQSAKLRSTKEIYLKHPEGTYRGGCSGGFYSYTI